MTRITHGPAGRVSVMHLHARADRPLGRSRRTEPPGPSREAQGPLENSEPPNRT